MSGNGFTARQLIEALQAVADPDATVVFVCCGEELVIRAVEANGRIEWQGDRGPVLVLQPEPPAPSA